MDNIELRSEKSRNIIGQIPNIIIRLGITIIMIFFLGILAAAYFLKLPHSVNEEAILINKNDGFVLKFESSILDKLKQNQEITIVFNNLPQTNSYFYKTKIISISNIVNIGYNQQFIYCKTEIPDSLPIDKNNYFVLIDSVKVNIEINLGKKSLLERYFK